MGKKSRLDDELDVKEEKGKKVDTEDESSDDDKDIDEAAFAEVVEEEDDDIAAIPDRIGKEGFGDAEADEPKEDSDEDDDDGPSNPLEDYEAEELGI